MLNSIQLNRRKIIFNEFVDFLQIENINYVIVGNTLNYPGEIEGDIDIVVSENDFSRAQEYIESFCKANNYVVCNCLQHEIKAKYFVIAAKDDLTETVTYLALDICTNYYRYARQLILSKDLLSERKLNQSVHEDSSFYIPNDGIAFLYYFIKKVEKKSFSAAQLAYLQTLIQRSPKSIEQSLQTVFLKVDVDKIIRAFNDVNYEILTLQFLSDLKQYLLRKYKVSFWERIKEYRRKIYRTVNPTGIVIGFMGCDGSGKSTIINQIQNFRLNNGPFRSKTYFHLYPTRKSNTGITVTNPHELTKRNPLLSNLKLFYFFVKYLLGYWLIVYPKKAKSNLVIFDRYYHDIMVDPIRYRHGGSRFLTNLIGRLIPVPDIFFFIDAPAKVIYERKQEVSFAEVERQRNAYVNLASRLKNAYVINNISDPGSVSYKVEKIVVEHLSTRYQLKKQ